MDEELDDDILFKVAKRYFDFGRRFYKWERGIIDLSITIAGEKFPVLNTNIQKLFDGALRRRQLRLILGGKMKPDDAAELKALFVKG